MSVYRVKGIKRVKRIVSGRLETYLYYRVNGGFVRLREKEGTPEFLLEIEELKQSGKDGDKRIDEKPGTWGWLIKHYQLSPEYGDLTEKTRKDYQSHMQWLSKLSQQPLARFTRAEIIKIRNKRFAQARARTGKGYRSAENLVGFISSVWAWGRLNDLIKSAENPAHGVPKFTRTKEHKIEATQRAWTKREVIAALKATKGGVRLAIALAIYTGQRRADILALRWESIREGYISITQSKTITSLKIPIHPDLQKILEDCADFTGPVVRNNSGEAYTSDGFQTMYSRALKPLKDAGLIRPDRRFHDLRHTAATWLADSGADDRLIMSITGHKQTSMVSNYTAGADQKRRATEAIGMMESILGDDILENQSGEIGKQGQRQITKRH